MSSKRKAPGAATVAPSTTVTPPPAASERPIQLRQVREPTSAEVSRTYFERPGHYVPLFTIGMSAEVVEQGLGDNKSAAAARLRVTAKAIEQRARELDRFRAEIGGDERLDVTSRFMERTRVQRAAVEKLVAAINEAGKVVTEFVGSMAADMRAAWTKAGPETPITPAEIRAHVARVDALQRAEFVKQAIANGDGAVVHAVLTAPHYMLGLAREEVERLTDEAHEAFAPDAVKERRALLTAIERFTEQSEAALAAYRISDADAAHFDRTEAALNAAKDRAQSVAGGINA